VRGRLRGTGLGHWGAGGAAGAAPRISLKEPPRVEQGRPPPAPPANADVPGDVAPQLALWQAEAAEPAWDGAPGVVAGEEEGRAARLVLHYHRARLVGVEQGGRVHFGSNGWIGTVRPSRRPQSLCSGRAQGGPVGGLLRVSDLLYANKGFPHAEERP